MRHQVRGRKLNRTASHRKALMKNLATSLFEHKHVKTTLAKAKELRPFAEQLITKAKKALQNEKSGLLAEGQKVDVHSRRVVGRDIRNKAVLQELFDTIAPLVEERPGGYCRITKLGTRRGDGGEAAIIELVDWSAPQDGTVSLKARKKAMAKKAESKKRGKKAKKTESEEAHETEVAEDKVDKKAIKPKMPEKPIAETEEEEVADESADTSEEEPKDESGDEEKS
ncbi:MAG: 50S ribosomal protein L17 [Ignavibacteria bacterium GWB2_35_12]|nr:MAG: 50S ribosomal protein L17 [Ignavibacteria bacterium GWA2_35_8]OGU39785.1 MAG: 50S ribosomal protein L17 [Ignavibacteria bacterium GWB2_35_12]OGU95556.1 MAG: 50S ribosomal protein L17 [Ignavibacteria bacterium RIFOXYA2_FULL_35_10]OGV21325.1 MAG: 50S ribosomal protein L17 [Ignavibacteria bacterium RIFOXYC2_FULL_35_21]